MANVFDYLEWRGDIPLDADPFNEVDNLVLAMLSYTDFGGIVGGDGKRIPLGEACRVFFSQHTREEILARTSFTAKAPLMMEKMIRGQRFGNMTLRNYTEESGDGYQLAAVTFGLEDGTEYVAFRGTDGTVAGWKEDFNFSFMDETEGQRLAVQYLSGITVGGTGENLRVGGHSKGGNLAIYASAFCEGGERIFEVYSNDGPGFKEEIVQRAGFAENLAKVKKFIPDSSIIGLLLSEGEDYTVVKSTAMGIKQHDAFTWKVERNRFVKAPLSDMSKVTKKLIDTWLETMKDEERQTFTELIFTLIESTGQERFSSMKADKLKTAESILNAVRLMPKEKQQEALQLLGVMGLRGGQKIADFLARKTNELPGLFGKKQ